MWSRAFNHTHLIPGAQVQVWAGGRGKKKYATIKGTRGIQIAVQYRNQKEHGLFTWIDIHRIIAVEVEEQELDFYSEIGKQFIGEIRNNLKESK